MSEITQLLTAAAAGDPNAAGQLLPLVYSELRRLADQRLKHEPILDRPGATSLVHDVYVRLAGSAPDAGWTGRSHFFGAAAEAMRRILIEKARKRAALKYGGEFQRIPLDEALAAGDDAEQILMVNDALDVFAQEDPEAAELFKLHYFVGLKTEDAAEVFGFSKSKADRMLRYARAWFEERFIP
jgi:RNA polymerase sigma factor (TIGR02999 family)